MGLMDKLTKRKQETVSPTNGGPVVVEEESSGGLFHAEDENKERGNWTGKLDFLLSAIGYAVGLGNVWRFPYKAYANGGASFLIPYVIMLCFAGLPLFFMEMALGQFASLGPISVWRIAPAFKGIGWAMVIISFLVCIYYNMIIAYTLYYTFASFTSQVPWADCKPEWMQYGCVPRNTTAEMRNMSRIICDKLMDTHGEMAKNHSDYITHCVSKSPSEIYWEREVLDMSESIKAGSADIKWDLALCLLLAWIIIFACLSKGIKSSGKVVYVTATFPYIVLVILLIRNCLLPGAWKGIKFYIVPDWAKLQDATVWHSAATQIFYSLGVAFGGLETMASYNRFRNNVYRDSVIVAILNCATSVFAGFVIFAVIGFMANELGVEVKDVAASGPGLAFIAYPEGLAMMPIAPFWAILFFVMLFTLGLDSQFAMMETVISAIVDEFPWFRVGKRKIIFTLLLCIVLFFLGLPQCGRNGIYVMNLFDWYSASFGLMVVALFELIVVSWIYGYKNFIDDVYLMIGYKANYYWIINWVFISPALLVFIIIFAAVTNSDAVYGDYVYEKDVTGWGYFFLAIALLPIPICALVEFGKQRNWCPAIRKITSPTDNWGPALDKFRTGKYKPLGNPNEPYTAPAIMEKDPSNGGVSNPGFEKGSAEIYPL